LGGLGLLWTGIDLRRAGRIVAGSIVLAVGAYTYQPALLINVLLAGWTLVVMPRRLDRQELAAVLVGALAALLVLLPYGLAARDPLFLRRAE
jgi:hypothetical protein